MSPKKRLYAEARMSGNSKRKSAIMAGYAEKSASQEAARLEKDKAVLRVWDAAGWTDTGQRLAVVSNAAPSPVAVMDEPVVAVAPELAGRTYSDPLLFLQNVMNDAGEDVRVRIDAAKSLALYTKQKPGESGKKEQKEKAAGKVAGGRFSPAKPPLSVVKT